jgi:hypothetical protein
MPAIAWISERVYAGFWLHGLIRSDAQFLLGVWSTQCKA